jgi:hypothetical protein
MSKLEIRIQNELTKSNIKFELHKPVPIDNFPWQTNRTRTSPKCDIYLPDFELYIEIKGFMTYRAVSTLSYLSRQSFNYYIFQGTEPEWNPHIDTNVLQNEKEVNQKLSNGKQLEKNIKHQILEITNLTKDSKFLNDISAVSLKRLKHYIGVKINEYKDWNKEWY